MLLRNDIAKGAWRVRSGLLLARTMLLPRSKTQRVPYKCSVGFKTHVSSIMVLVLVT